MLHVAHRLDLVWKALHMVQGSVLIWPGDQPSDSEFDTPALTDSLENKRRLVKICIKAAVVNQGTRTPGGTSKGPRKYVGVGGDGVLPPHTTGVELGWGEAELPPLCRLP